MRLGERVAGLLGMEPPYLRRREEERRWTMEEEIAFKLHDLCSRNFPMINKFIGMRDNKIVFNAEREGKGWRITRAYLRETQDALSGWIIKTIVSPSELKVGCSFVLRRGPGIDADFDAKYYGNIKLVPFRNLEDRVFLEYTQILIAELSRMANWGIVKSKTNPAIWDIDSGCEIVQG